jgi:hypothetical protein
MSSAPQESSPPRGGKAAAKGPGNELRRSPKLTESLAIKKRWDALDNARLSLELLDAAA